MKAIRWFLGKIILFGDRIFTPKLIVRSNAEKQRIRNSMGAFSLYQFEACPFCVKVRRFLKSEGIEMPLRDATREPDRGDLASKGGKLQVPCLRIAKEGGGDQWLYESGDIISYLKRIIEQPA